MVHLSVVADDRRERSRDKKRQRFIAAAGRIIDRDGLAGVTMQAVADELDCAVGTIYTYFPSKAALLTALQQQAVDTLGASYRTARAGWDGYLDAEELERSTGLLVQLVAFGGFVTAASVVFADEFHLQRLFLVERVTATTREEARRALPVLLRLTAAPEALLDDAAAEGVLRDGAAGERALRWLAALDGVLLLDNLSALDRHLFRGPHLARELTRDLLVGWGADPEEVDVAATHVDRLTALGPLAPPPEGPGFDR